MRDIVHRLLALFGIAVSKYRTERGFVLWVRRKRYNVPTSSMDIPRGFGGMLALEIVPGMKVLDVGSGGGGHARYFKQKGASVTCVDLGTSVYAHKRVHEEVTLIACNFLEYYPAERFDLVWASHVLEHQPNAGLFIRKIVDCSAPGKTIAITVPMPNFLLEGGHLSFWTPGTLLHNLVFNGVDCSQARIIETKGEFTVIVGNQATQPKPLTLDRGDVELLASYFPRGYAERGPAM